MGEGGGDGKGEGDGKCEGVKVSHILTSHCLSQCHSFPGNMETWEWVVMWVSG